MKYEFAPFQLDISEGRLSRSGKEIKLTPRLFKLLSVLVEHHGQLLEYDRLMQMAWGRSVERSNVTVSIKDLRQALGCDGLVEAVAGRGYRFTAEVRVIYSGARPDEEEPPPPGGALPIDTRFYVARKTDEEFYRAIARGDSLVLVKGARQVGKTSLLARGLQKARESGAVVVLTDLQHPSADTLASSEKLLLELGDRIAEQLDLKAGPHDVWSNLRGASSNFTRYLRREVLEKISAPLVWGLDEIDRLFKFDYAGEIFGLFRSWHNLRALEPAGPWRRMTLAMAYATEAHLFITDLNQSPFNVGTRLVLEDFTREQAAELNRCFGSPLEDEDELDRFVALAGGHPFLVYRGLYEMAERDVDLAAIESAGDHEEGVFGEPLRRMLESLKTNETLCEAVRGVLEGKPQMTAADFYHLRAAGVLAGDSARNARLRCRIYADFLTKHLM